VSTGFSSVRGRILIVDHRIPTPDKDSGSRSTFSYLQILSRAGFELTFAPANFEPASRYSMALGALGVKTVTGPEWTSLKHVIKAFAPRCDLLLLYRAPVARRVFDLARSVAPHARILFQSTDLHFLRMQREAELSGHQADKERAAAARQTELALFTRADASIVVSTYERDLLRELVPQAPVHEIPILIEMPRRSPGELLHWHERGLCQRLGSVGRWLNRRDRALQRRSALMFLGGFAHLPNGDGIKWFVREVWPLLQARGFPHRLIIAGSEVPDDVAALASDQIEVRGYVEDLATLYSACRISIAPLRYGAGVKGKVVASLSFGVPVVATSVAAEGTGLHHGETVLIADTPTEMADAIVRLYEEADLWQRLSYDGYRFCVDRFSLAAGARKLLPLVDSLIAQTRGSGTR
jgi:glycosyltransferase involved in cell wall biosynthesis